VTAWHSRSRLQGDSQPTYLAVARVCTFASVGGGCETVAMQDSEERVAGRDEDAAAPRAVRNAKLAFGDVALSRAELAIAQSPAASAALKAALSAVPADQLVFARTAATLATQAVIARAGITSLIDAAAAGTESQRLATQVLAGSFPQVASFVKGLHRDVLKLSGYSVPDLLGVAPARLPFFNPTIQHLLGQVRDMRPPNWVRDADIRELDRLVKDEGIPLAWVPRAEVVEMVRAAPDRASRLDVLLTARSEVLADCSEVLRAIDDPEFVGREPLARRAIAAMNEGHHESAMALAVNVVDSMMRTEYRVRYGELLKQLNYELGDVLIRDSRWRLSLAPCVKFFAEFDFWSDPPPDDLARHAAVHKADIEHYNETNSLIAVMLLVSVMRGLQDKHEVQA
jgi:hypothetical protein